MGTKFKYLGKKKNFKLDPKAYKFNKGLNYGDEFELEGTDLIAIKRCLNVAKSQGIEDKDMDIVLAAAHEYASIPDEVIEEESEDDGELDSEEEVAVDLGKLKVNELLKICKDKNITPKAGSSKPELIAFIKSN